jgi:NAD(P)-dependent dehydrogenase (short-subunit alcohol dehydrogenase family)
MAFYLVTGASSGIGRALVYRAVREGHRVAGVARRKELLGELGAELGPAFVPLVADVTDLGAVVALCEGLDALPDVVILSAGLGEFDATRGFDVALHQRTMAVNYFGALHFVHALLPAMRERGTGVFVAISSLAGFRGMPRSAAYSASKAALSTAFESLRVHGGMRGLHFLTVHPGFVATPMTADNPKGSMPFLLTADQAARRILNGIRRGRTHIDFPWPMALAARLARLLPAWLWARLAR